MHMHSIAINPSYGLRHKGSVISICIGCFLYNGVMFDGSSIVGYKQIENSDMKAVPELSSYTILTNENYAGKTVRFICKIFNPDGTRFDGDPRYILEKQVERLSRENKKINIGPELEYFNIPPR